MKRGGARFFCLFVCLFVGGGGGLGGRAWVAVEGLCQGRRGVFIDTMAMLSNVKRKIVFYKMGDLSQKVIRCN